MEDLTDEDLETLSRDLVGARLKSMAAELQRRRAEQAAGREHVERVVREHVAIAVEWYGRPTAENEAVAKAVARRVADRLSVPVPKPTLAERRAALGLGDVTAEERAANLADNLRTSTPRADDVQPGRSAPIAEAAAPTSRPDVGRPFRDRPERTRTCASCDGSGKVPVPYWLSPSPAGVLEGLPDEAIHALVVGSATIFEATREASEIATIERRPVAFRFLDRVVVVRPGEDPISIANAWWIAQYGETPAQTAERR